MEIKDIFCRKVSFFDRQLIKNFVTYFGYIFGGGSAIVSFLNLSHPMLITIVIVLFLSTVVIYFFNYAYANAMSRLTLTLGSANIEVKIGDIFECTIFNDNDVIKVIPFNQYFDTQLDDNIVVKSSVNGQFLEKIFNGTCAEYSTDNQRKIITKNAFDARIEYDEWVNKYKLEAKSSRTGKNQPYKLGSIFRYDHDIFATALSEVDEENRSVLSIQDYIRFLINFWDQLDCLYGGRKVYMTLLGSGMTRLSNQINEEQTLQTILFILCLSQIKFSDKNKLTILLRPETLQKINLYKVKKTFKDFQGVK